MRLLMVLILIPFLHSCIASDQEVRHNLYSIETLISLGQYDDAREIARSAKRRDPHYDKCQVWLDIIDHLEAHPEMFAFDNSARHQDAFYRKTFAAAGVPYP